MSNKTSRNLQFAAVILFGIALIAGIVSIFVQAPLKRLMDPNPSLAEIVSVPWPSLIFAGFRLILSVICLIVIAGKPSRGGAIALTVVSAILLSVSSAVVEPVLNTALVSLIAKGGSDAFKSYSALSNVVSWIVNVLCVPAYVLMLLSLGGCIPKKQ